MYIGHRTKALTRRSRGRCLSLLLVLADLRRDFAGQASRRCTTNFDCPRQDLRAIRHRRTASMGPHFSAPISVRRFADDEPEPHLLITGR